MHYLDSAQRAVQSGGASRKPTGKGRECATESRFRRAMWPREPTARSDDIVAVSGRHWPSQCLRVLQRSTAVCAAAKNTKSLAARAGSCGAGSQPIPSTNAKWHTNGQMLVSDVAARDVQAATSPANRIAPARTKSWRFAGGGLGGGGEKPTRQRPSLWMASIWLTRLFILLKCGRDEYRRAELGRPQCRSTTAGSIHNSRVFLPDLAKRVLLDNAVPK